MSETPIEPGADWRLSLLKFRGLPRDGWGWEFLRRNLDFRYRITGDNPHWRPLRAFDDGRKVYIEFPKDIAQTDAPPLFVVGASGSSDLVNYRVRGRYYIVDRLFGAAELRLGEDKQQIVRITRTDGRQNGGSASLFGG